MHELECSIGTCGWQVADVVVVSRDQVGRGTPIAAVDPGVDLKGTVGKAVIEADGALAAGSTASYGMRGWTYVTFASIRLGPTVLLNAQETGSCAGTSAAGSVGLAEVRALKPRRPTALTRIVSANMVAAVWLLFDLGVV